MWSVYDNEQELSEARAQRILRERQEAKKATGRNGKLNDTLRQSRECWSGCARTGAARTHCRHDHDPS